MAQTSLKFPSVLLCEDVRDEMGNKKSLMGVFVGDIIVSELPAVLQLALFALYERPDLSSDHLYFRLMQDDEEIVAARVDIPEGGTRSATAILPKALMKVEQECVFSVRVSREEDGPQTTILEKKIMKAPSTPIPA